MQLHFQEKEAALLEAALLAGHQNHHQKIHYMEKLKQQNIDLSEVSSEDEGQQSSAELSEMGSGDEVDFVGSAELAELHEKIQFYEQKQRRKSASAHGGKLVERLRRRFSLGGSELVLESARKSGATLLRTRVCPINPDVLRIKGASRPAK